MMARPSYESKDIGLQRLRRVESGDRSPCPKIGRLGACSCGGSLDVSVPVTPYRSDSRGGVLERWSPVDDRTGHVVWLRGPAGAATQLLHAGAGYTLLETPAWAQNQWTHVLTAPGRLSQPSSCLLNLLLRIVTLPTTHPLDAAVALDWYKVIDPDLSPRDWQNTSTGQLIADGKYNYAFDQEQVRRAGTTVVRLVCEALDSHSVFGSCPLVADIPGHDTKNLSFGSRMAAAVARSRNRQLIPVHPAASFRPSMKNIPAQQRASVLHNHFRVDLPIGGHDVLIVDDVFQSGTSMTEVARALKTAGARSVFGISAVRTVSSGRNAA